jgi:Cytochrome b5-like Heme/Steroid binding domain
MVLVMSLSSASARATVLPVSDRRLAATCLVVTVAILVGYTLWSFGSDDPGPGPDPNRPATAAAAATIEADPDDRLISPAEVARHATRDDCWTIIDDEVYDLTDFIGSHPGGAVIVDACGEDATTLFEDRRTPDGAAVGSGEEHSDDAEDQLDELQIGVTED